MYQILWNHEKIPRIFKGVKNWFMNAGANVVMQNRALFEWWKPIIIGSFSYRTLPHRCRIHPEVDFIFLSASDFTFSLVYEEEEKIVKSHVHNANEWNVNSAVRVRHFRRDSASMCACTCRVCRPSSLLYSSPTHNRTMQTITLFVLLPFVKSNM